MKNRVLLSSILALLLSLMWVALPSCSSSSSSSSSETDTLMQLYLLQSRFTDNLNGTITEGTLTWMKCAQGQAWASVLNNCQGTGAGTTYGATSMNWCQYEGLCFDATTLSANAGPAYDSCNGLSYAGATDWRLPTRYELALLASNITYSGYIAFFPDTPDDKYFWSGTVNTDNTKEAVIVGFGESSFGEVQFGTTNTAVHYVRCVRP